jgi:hypothetical protein
MDQTARLGVRGLEECAVQATELFRNAESTMVRLFRPDLPKIIAGLSLDNHKRITKIEIGVAAIIPNLV